MKCFPGQHVVWIPLGNPLEILTAISLFPQVYIHRREPTLDFRIHSHSGQSSRDPFRQKLSQVELQKKYYASLWL